MNVENRDPVLRRKLAPKADPEPATEPVSTGAAAGLRRAFARAISDAAPLIADAGTVQRQTVSQAELLDMLDGDAFVAVLRDADGETGLAVLDQSGFSAVIEAMTIGRLAPRAPMPRRPTPTDASLLADLLDATLAGLSEPGSTSLRFHRAVADHRLLAVLVEDITYDFVSANFSLLSGDMERPALVAFALPHHPAQDPADPEEECDGGVGLGWTKTLEAAVMASPATLRAELGRLTMPLSRVLDLGIGDTLTLPLSNLEDIQLVALDGQAQAVGRLGQSRGNRAIRLTCWPGGAPPMADMINAVASSSASDAALLTPAPASAPSAASTPSSISTHDPPP